MPPLTTSALRIADAQLGVLTRAQLLEAGVSRSSIEWQLGRTWRQLLPGVVLLDRGLPTMEQRQVAALLLAGPESVLSASTAAAVHGLATCSPGPPITVLVPRPRRSRHVAWVSVRRTTVTDPGSVTRGPLRLSSLPRAVVDAAAAATTDRQAQAIVLESIQRRMVRLDDLHHWANVRGSGGTARVRRALDVAATGVWSAPEGELMSLVGTSAILPEPWANPALMDAAGRRLTTPDLWFDDVALAVMVHSRQFHADVLDWEATVESDADLLAAGIIVVPVTPASLRRDPGRVLRVLERAHRSAKARGTRPSVTATRKAHLPLSG